MKEFRRGGRGMALGANYGHPMHHSNRLEHNFTRRQQFSLGASVMAAPETKTNLEPNTVNYLQELIQMNLDSHDCLNQLAEKTDVEAIGTLMRDIAAERMDQVSELRTLVAANFEEPKQSGSFAAAAQRVLLNIRAALGGGAKVMLEEAEKAEDSLKSRYEEIIKSIAGSAVSDVLHRQLGTVKVAHDRVKAMRDNVSS